MKVPVFVASIFLSALIAVQGWTLAEVIALKVSVARIEQRLSPDPVTKTEPPQNTPTLENHEQPSLTFNF